MGLSRQDAQKQARRLQASPMLAPQSDDGRREIVDCLMRNCDDAEHAERTMTALIDGVPEPRNLTANIAIAAGETRRRDVQIPEKCESCPADDWEYVPYKSDDGFEYLPSVRRHHCPRGRALRERDARAWEELESRRPRNYKTFGGDNAA